MIRPIQQDDAFLADLDRAGSEAAPDSLHVWWLGQSGFLLQWQGQRLLLDPYLSDSLTRKYATTDKPHVRMTERVVDPSRLSGITVVTASHAHTDHLDPETLLPLAQSNPLTQAIKASFADALMGLGYGSNGDLRYPEVLRLPRISSVSAGLGSRDVRAGHFISIVENLRSETPRDFSVVGIKHPLALPVAEDPDIRPEGAFSMRGHSVGGFGSVTTNKLIASFVGELFDLHVQAYPKYGSEKKGLPTTYYLTVADEHIRCHSELDHVEFIPLNDVNAFNLGNPLAGIASGGSVFIQSHHTDARSVWDDIPAYGRKVIRMKNLRVYYLDTVKIARGIATDPDLQQRMQGVVLVGIFIKVTPFAARSRMGEDEVLGAVEKYVRKYFGKRGEHVVQENLACVKKGLKDVQEIPSEVIQSPESSSPQDRAGESIAFGK